MSAAHPLPENPRQVLPREAYVSDAWLEREQEALFSNSWLFAGVVTDFAEAGDYKTLRVGDYPLVILKDKDGALQAFHNLCRHRGTELLEGAGNAGKAVVCPYHYWAYNLDGSLRGVPNQATCFPDLDKSKISLKPASIGVFHGLVFVHPSRQPEESFDAWIGPVRDVAWPHDITAGNLREFDGDVVYELQCNWKVFVENALDGYHLAYLHNKTLGGPKADENFWETHGRHMVWYATETGARSRVPRMITEESDKYGLKKFKGAETLGYGGVYLLFPNTLILPTPYSISVSWLEPVDPHTTLLHLRNWAPGGFGSYRDKLADIPGYDKATGRIHSANWTKHPLEYGDFQTEDTWVCEKMQRSLRSPAYEVGGLARGAGAEAPLACFQANVQDFIKSES